MAKLQNTSRRYSTVAVVDSLAEITRYLDREMIERSLLCALADFDRDQELRLYKVIAQAPKIELGLIGHHFRGALLTESSHQPHEIEPELSEAIGEAIASGDLVAAECVETGRAVHIYPIFDRDGELYSLLVQVCSRLSLEAQRLTHGLLKIYSNYLSLLDISQKDKLTNLLNRDRLHNWVTRMLLRRRRARSDDGDGRRRAGDTGTHWLAMIDIDHFKRINDRYGHLAGDEVLIAFARLMGRVFRGDDLLFRFGGEEFVAIIEVSERAHAAAAFERFRGACERHGFPVVGRLTASLGVVQIETQREAAEVIASADRAMYLAKSQGRNRVAFHDELVDDGQAGQQRLARAGKAGRP